jgi:hypothetical protein
VATLRLRDRLRDRARFRDGAAQESNLPSLGLPDLTGALPIFEGARATTTLMSIVARPNKSPLVPLYVAVIGSSPACWLRLFPGESFNLIGIHIEDSLPRMFVRVFHDHLR